LDIMNNIPHTNIRHNWFDTHCNNGTLWSSSRGAGHQSLWIKGKFLPISYINNYKTEFVSFVNRSITNNVHLAIENYVHTYVGTQPISANLYCTFVHFHIIQPFCKNAWSGSIASVHVKQARMHLSLHF